MRLSQFFLPVLFCFNFIPTSTHTSGDKTRACTEYAQTKIDDVTGRQVVISKNKLKLTDVFTKRKFNLLISRQGFELIFVFSTDDGTCILKDTGVSMKFEDGSDIKFKSSNANNCKGQLNLSFGGIYGNLDDLMTVANKQLKEVSFLDKNEKEINLFMNRIQGKELKNTIDCVMSASL